MIEIMELWTRFVVTLLGILTVSAAQTQSGLYEGSTCTLPNTIEGLCQPIQECPAALLGLKKHQTHYFSRCGFNGFTEIVCCPNISKNIEQKSSSDDDIVFGYDDDESSVKNKINNTVTTEVTTPPTRVGITKSDMLMEDVPLRKSQQACKEYSNEVPFGLSFHILGGDSVSLGEYPHMAALGYSKFGEDGFDWNCGGSLISDRFVLTAAHCVVNADARKPTVVRLGKIDILGNSDGTKPEDYDVEEVVVHPRYRRSSNMYDLALIRLAKSVTYGSTVNPACLEVDAADRSAEDYLTVTGWGTVSTKTTEKSALLLKANLTAVPLTDCNTTYISRGPTRRLPHGLSDGMMCAYDPEGLRDSCTGDSGGPLQIRQPDGKIVIEGVTSFGIACGGSSPGVYTRVATYINWIESVVWP